MPRERTAPRHRTSSLHSVCTVLRPHIYQQRMKLKDFFAFKDWLSYRQKVGLLVIAGVVCGLGGLFMYLLRAHTYFIGDNPSACVNCHIMTPY